MSADSSHKQAGNNSTDAKVRQPKKGRSSVTNGKALLIGIDGRTQHAKRFRDLVRAFTDELGGHPSEVDKGLVKQAAAMELKVEMLHADLVNGLRVPTDDLTRATSEARRLTELIRSKSKRPKEAPAST